MKKKSVKKPSIVRGTDIDHIECFSILAHPINVDVNNELEDLALSDGQYWVHCTKSNIKSFRNEIFD